MFIQTNPNPKQIFTSDCVVRALSIAQNQSWEKTYLELCIQGYARGRGSNARRDSMGRYSSDNYSMRDGRSGARGRSYSYDDEMNNLREQLEDMERMAKDEESKRMIRQWKMQLN